ncbi:MAG: hypothetical protein II859_02975 [Bacteroidales bacterium]|nr:hypothetical protein [Bacteroidales bacterium]
MFFEKIVEHYPQLDEYWVIARSENKLYRLLAKIIPSAIMVKFTRVEGSVPKE